MLETAGIHHISAMVNDAQRTVTFYTGILGVRLVKKTVNYARTGIIFILEMIQVILAASSHFFHRLNS